MFATMELPCKRWRIVEYVSLRLPVALSIGPMPSHCNGHAPGASQSQWSAPWSFTIGRPAPLAVTTVAPIQRDSAVLTKATFKWTRAQYACGVSYATLYDVEISTTANFTGELITRTALADTTTGPINLQPTTTYYWRARAANGSAAGAWSAVAMFTTYGTPRSRDLLLPLDKSTAVNIRPTCTWQSDPWADSYTVELDTSAHFSVLDHIGHPISHHHSMYIRG